MSVYVLPPPPIVAVPVEGETAAFPVRRIFCVGRNYAAHRREMGGDDREPPCFFTKPADAAIGPGHDIPYPPATGDLHHEIELVVALSGGGANVSTERALDLVFGYAAGVDLTRRDLQNDAKDKRQPWDSSKAFDFSAPVSAIRKWSDATPVGRIALSVNGEARQDARLTDTMWSVPEIIAGRPDIHRHARGRRAGQARRCRARRDRGRRGGGVPGDGALTISATPGPSPSLGGLRRPPR
jgi:fumarylpyruvate hydrolase